jgi:phage terminase small subunit
MGGRPRKPIELHKAQGSYRPDRHGNRREAPATGDLSAQAAPTHLSEAERQVWRQVLNVAPARLLKSADASLLAAYCSAVARHRRASVAYWQSPLTDEKGHVTSLSRELARLELIIARLGGEMGLSPLGRTKISAPPTPASYGEIETPEFVARFGRLQVVPSDKSD